MGLQLIAKINDAELLRKSIHDLGTLLYQKDEEGNILKVVYFSGSRLIEYNGKINKNLAKRITNEGHAVNLIEINDQGSVKIVQNNENGS